jgi:thymidylate synthase
MNIESQYIMLVQNIMRRGELRNDRTGVGTKALFGVSLSGDLRDGFPLLTSKKMSFKNVASELLWFIKGDDSLNYLHKYNNHIWDANYNATGKPAMYPKAWRDIRKADGTSIDQLSNLIDGIRNNPYSRRHILVSQIPQMLDNVCLDACHTMVQFYVSNDGELDCQMYQRSADMGLGVPYNIASYALLTELIASHTGLVARNLKIVMGDAHVYSNHEDALREQCNRPKSVFPRLIISRDVNVLEDFEVEDLEVVGYQCGGSLTMPMAV